MNLVSQKTDVAEVSPSLLLLVFMLLILLIEQFFPDDGTDRAADDETDDDLLGNPRAFPFFPTSTQWPHRMGW